MALVPTAKELAASAETEKQTVKLYEKMKVYSQGGRIDNTNLLSSVIFGMNELGPKKLPGEDKKSMLTQVMMTIVGETKDLLSEVVEEITPDKIENIIESVYLGFRDRFVRKGCCG
jgi:hypothetical protein